MGLIERIELTVSHSGYDGKYCWVHARAGVLPSKSDNSALKVIMTAQKLDVTGSDVFYGLNTSESHDFGENWTEFKQLDAFKRKKLSRNQSMTISDFSPKWHKKTQKLLGTGHTVVYKKNRVKKVRPRATSYSVYDESLKTWLPWKQLEMPDREEFKNCGAGSVQRYDMENGDILLPVSFKRPKDKISKVMVCRCNFDGENLRFLEHGNYLSECTKRGIGEPSITFFKNRYFLTIRHDDRAYCAISKNGLDFEELQPWTYQDGTELGNYNTQQHWITHSDGLFLIYTRKNANNDHVFRHRAPLFIAQVDPENMVIIQETEQIAIPERGARLGNFGTLDISPNESWIIASEWMQTKGPNHIIPVNNKYGANNSIHIAKIKWNKPNRLEKS